MGRLSVFATGMMAEKRAGGGGWMGLRSNVLQVCRARLRFRPYPEILFLDNGLTEILLEAIHLMHPLVKGS